MRYRTFLIIPFLVVSWTVAVARAGKHTQQTPDQHVERTSAADPGVVLSVCLRSGSITIHGWDRNQVRARASDGMRIDFERPASGNSGLPKELTLVTDAGGSRMGNPCLAFGDIELDVPREASVNLQAGAAEVDASGLAMLTINTQHGSIAVERVMRAVDINTIGGDISIRNSKGSIKLHTIGGSIDVNDVRPGAPGDVCEAGTVGGEITLAQVSHGQVKVSAVSGDVNFNSSLAHGGRYSFQIIRGHLSMSLPADSSFRLNANVGRGGEVASDFPLRYSSSTMAPTNTLKKHASNLRQIDAVYGTGDALISLSSFSGSIQLRKK